MAGPAAVVPGPAVPGPAAVPPPPALPLPVQPVLGGPPQQVPLPKKTIREDLAFYVPEVSGFSISSAEPPEGLPQLSGRAGSAWSVQARLDVKAPRAARFVVVDSGLASSSVVSLFVQRPVQHRGQTFWRPTPVLQDLITAVHEQLMSDEDEHHPEDAAPPAAAPAALPVITEVPPPGAGAGSGVGGTDVDYRLGPHHLDVDRTRVGQVVACMVDVVNSNSLRTCSGAQPPLGLAPSDVVEIGPNRAVVEVGEGSGACVARTLSCPYIVLGKRTVRCVGCNALHKAQGRRDQRLAKDLVQISKKRELEAEAAVGGGSGDEAGDQQVPNKVAKVAKVTGEGGEAGEGDAAPITPPKAKSSKESSPPTAAGKPMGGSGGGAGPAAPGPSPLMVENLIAAYRKVSLTEVRIGIVAGKVCSSILRKGGMHLSWHCLCRYVSCHQEEIKEVTESIAEEMETSELRKRLKAQIAAARLAPSAPGIGPVSGSTIVEELGKKNLKLTGIAAKMVDHMANYDSPDSTVMEYLSVNDKDAHDAWTRVATLRDHKAQLWIRLREEERVMEAAFQGNNNIPAMKQALDAYTSNTLPKNPKGTCLAFCMQNCKVGASDLSLPHLSLCNLVCGSPLGGDQ